MRLECAQGPSFSNVTPSDIEHVFSEGRLPGEFVILTADDKKSFIQAAEENAPHPLEYYDARTEVQYRATARCTTEEVKEAFLAYLNGDNAWRDAHTWKELEESGCRNKAAALILIAAGSATWYWFA